MTDGRVGPPVLNRDRRNWWERNWKWLVPVLVVGGTGLTMGLIAMTMAFVFGIIKGSEVYELALERAVTDVAVQAALGSPIEDDWMPQGQINYSGGSGDADLGIGLTGPMGRGRLYAVARRSAGVWSFSTLVVQVDKSGERIDLLRP